MGIRMITMFKSRFANVLLGLDCRSWAPESRF